MRPVVLAAVVLLLGGAAPESAPSVTIDNFAFTAAEITVPMGARVTWLNRDDIPHTVTDAGEPRGFRSPPLDTGETFSQVFPHAGTWHYFCSLHPHMQGTVVVR